MIRHEIFLCGSSGRRLAQSISALTVSMIEPAFKTALMLAAGLASLIEARAEAARVAAIAMPPVTMGADEEPGAAIGRRAKLLVEGEVVGRCHPDWAGSVDFRRPMMAT